MQARTEEFLYLLLWTCDCLFHPTYRNLSDSFEAWTYRNGFHRQVNRLTAQKFLEPTTDSSETRMHCLTEAGRLHVLCGRDPEVCWSQAWNGSWSLAMFDVAEKRRSVRNQLRQCLRARGFGHLQHSVWITPRPVEEERRLLADSPVDVTSLILMQAQPCGGETSAQIVAGAWDFTAINRGYTDYIEVVRRRPRGPIVTETEVTAFQRWLRQARAAWLHVVARDPLLPEVLLPSSYVGRRAWELHKRTMAKAAIQMRAFNPPTGNGTIYDAAAS